MTLDTHTGLGMSGKGFVYLLLSSIQIRLHRDSCSLCGSQRPELYPVHTTPDQSWQSTGLLSTAPSQELVCFMGEVLDSELNTGVVVPSPSPTCCVSLKSHLLLRPPFPQEYLLLTLIGSLQN